MSRGFFRFLGGLISMKLVIFGSKELRSADITGDEARAAGPGRGSWGVRKPGLDS